ncbi:MAG: AMP-binding protein [SAR202 cluster bacterium]|nr:AMP-binding protein [SAR202 cluster bacterium]|tara:strand:+ start:4693 stop:6321 length:1629 start_codon:yes stop_codon:yes gene_type:complete
MKQTYNIGNYSDTYNDFELDVPDRFNWAFDVFDKWGEDPSKTAMIWVGPDGSDREITFSEFTDRTNRLSNGLKKIGTNPGDRIFVMLPRLVEWWEIMIASVRGLFVPVPGTPLLTKSDITYRINASECSVAITDSENLDKIVEIKNDCPSLKTIIVVGDTTEHVKFEDLITESSDVHPHPNNLSTEPLIIYFTSGTTGYPKMVLNTHASYPIGHIITGRYWLDNRPTDLHWTLSDTGWAQAAWTHFYAPWNMGAAIFVWDMRGRFDASDTLKMLEKFPITTFFAPPTAYRMMVLENLDEFDLTSLRHCIGAGEALNPEVIDVWKKGTGHHIWEGYGQTETVLCVATFPGMKAKPGSMGVAAPGFKMGIVNENGEHLPVGEEGEIAISIKPDFPVGLFGGYWKNEEANNKCFRGNWYFTGDRGYVDEDGYYWFVGRADDVINSSSYRIGPFEVESALVEHDSVAEAAVIGKPDPIRGEIVKAYIVLTGKDLPSEKLKEELQNHVKTVTAPYKYPREIDFVEELPKTISGKIRRSELRDIEKSK